VILIFAIVGMEFYKGAFHATCFKVAPDGNVTTQLFDDDPRPCYMTTPGGAVAMGAFACPVNVSQCSLYWVGPNHGITSFDNIGNALVTVFQCFTMEGWTDIMYWCNDHFGGWANWIYFFAVVIIGSFMMLNLVLGVLSGQFAIEREKTSSRNRLFKTKEKSRYKAECKSYLEWVNKSDTTTQSCSINVEGSNKQVERCVSFNGYISYALEDHPQSLEPQQVFTSVFELDELQETKSNVIFETIQRWRRNIRKACKTQIWFWTIIVLVFLNTVCATTKFTNQPEWLDVFLINAEIAFLTFFTLEVLIKIIGLGPSLFFKSSFNIFDVVVILGSILDVIIKGGCYD
jgi:voltage-dependent calcium channel N type alpha-1B